MRVEALYFDGEIALDRAVVADIGEDGIRFEGPQVPTQSWSYASLTAVDPPSKGYPIRLKYEGLSGARLVIRNDAAMAELVRLAPHLRGGFNAGRAARAALWIAGGLAAAGLLGYLAVQFAPGRIAAVLPDSWRNRVGEQVEASLTEGASQCETAGGRAAISAMTARLAESDSALPTLSIRIYDIPVMNAWAMPGGRIIITRDLLERAEAPEEVAGVLAHELGHVAHRHSEAQLIRSIGLQLLLSAVTGGSSDTLGSVAGLAAILRYTRAAEREADAYANAILQKAAIDPMGLKRFFERLREQEGASAAGVWGRLGNVLATHPGTEERIELIKPLPEGVAARPVLSEAQWRELKRICR